MTDLSARFPRASGRISLVGAGPGAADLLTVRALRCLQAADVVLHDRLVTEEVLALIPPATRRIPVGKEVGANAWPQDRITALMLTEAVEGRHVVRLKSGDPAIFARAAEEIDAASALGIAVEIVPGITAASAAAASLGRPLTARGTAQRLLFVTATDEADRVTNLPLPEGTTLALYMASRKAAEIEAALLGQGADPDAEVVAVCRASQPDEHIHRCRLSGMAQSLGSDPKVTPPCVILIGQSLAQGVADAEATDAAQAR
ncbi:uroporphyrinogen-III C-methyltransferase [Tabrizicola oligotrophica]|uniref:uroporphyrinogen-III C-methyltransferase n=1 Tax=Tabrizicola oligotrophica TaxID=2710650 RepID=A0A6M0QQ27_9RHOB|nr:uroporphyrinogen-III C-methyltransferase [Tabrizicola oligotrophica]NEY89537.1 uroporphyrinogen-III C-methyltransferase [Tabrizicola oligotrophica]